MKIDKKKRNIIISLVVIILIILSLVLLIHKSKVDKNAASIKAQKCSQYWKLNKNVVKTAKGNAKTSTVKSGANGVNSS